MAYNNTFSVPETSIMPLDQTVNYQTKGQVNFGGIMNEVKNEESLPPCDSMASSTYSDTSRVTSYKRKRKKNKNKKKNAASLLADALLVPGAVPPGLTEKGTTVPEASYVTTSHPPPAKRRRAHSIERHEVHSSRGNCSKESLDNKIDKNELSVIITSSISHQLTPPQVQSVMQQLEIKLVQEALSHGPDTFGPTLRGKPVYADGGIKLWCENIETRNWLQNHLGEVSERTGLELTLMRSNEIPHRLRCGILLPGIWHDPSVVMCTLKLQNRWAAVDCWLMHKVIPEPTKDHTFLMVGVPEEVLPLLEQRQRRFAFMFGSVYLKYQGPGGKYQRIVPKRPQRSYKRPRVRDTAMQLAYHTIPSMSPHSPLYAPSQSEYEESMPRLCQEYEEECAEVFRNLDTVWDQWSDTEDVVLY